MKRVITLLSCIVALGLCTINTQAQSCAPNISTLLDSTTSGGAAMYTFTAYGNFNPSCQFSWSFGDGTGGQGQTVTHTFGSLLNSVYIVQLTMTDATNSCTGQAYDTIGPVSNTSPCSAYFNFSNTDTLFTLYTVNTGVPPFTYNWDMPNGTFSTLPDPTYTIGSTGTYNGFVVVTDSTGCIDTVNYTLSYANVAGNNGCQAYFYVVPDTTTGAYTAVDCSSGTSLIYEWYFGDGDSSSQQYPSHTYAAPGYYTICLTVVSSNGCTSSFCDSAFYAYKNNDGPMSGITVTSKSAATGIKNIQANNGISVYPNPATTALAVQVSGNDKIESSAIYNTDGQKVAEFGPSSLLSISGLTAGVYMIEVKTKNGTFHSIFVKKD